MTYQRHFTAKKHWPRWFLAKPHCACCISHDCKLDLVTLQGNPTGDQYIRDVLQPVVASHFDNHSLATRPVYMDDNARPHHSRAVTAYLQSEAVTSVPCPAMSLDLNPIEHIWDMLGCRIQNVHAREPPVQNIHQLEAAAITIGHPTSNWRDETQGWGRHPSTWGLHPVLNFEQ
jgi:transposase